jgi:solute carrier family 25 phosphate transporter 3
MNFSFVKNSVAFAPAEGKPAPTGLDKYLRYAAAGALCCAITHAAVVPVDVVKTRMQTNPGKYKSMGNGFKTIVAEEGAGMLLQGLGPTAAGYFMQGAFKFGFYEFFKLKYSGAMSEENAKQYRIPIWLAASATAETIADLFLCPMEATRIRLVADPSFAKGLPDAFGKIIKSEGVLGLYKGLPPILFKQVPYTMAKFAVFEFVAESTYKVLASAGMPKEKMSEGSRLTVSLGSGVVAGLVAAIVSQPADTVLSKINQEKTDAGMMKAIGNIMKRLGAKGLFLGLGARMVMVGTLTAGQFFIYDYTKSMMGVAAK